MKDLRRFELVEIASSVDSGHPHVGLYKCKKKLMNGAPHEDQKVAHPLRFYLEPYTASLGANYLWRARLCPWSC